MFAWIGLPLSPLLEVSDRIIEATASDGTQHTLDVVHSVSTGRGGARASHSRTGVLPLVETTEDHYEGCPGVEGGSWWRGIGGWMDGCVDGTSERAARER